MNTNKLPEVSMKGEHSPTPWKTLDAEDDDMSLIVGANGEGIASGYI